MSDDTDQPRVMIVGRRGFAALATAGLGSIAGCGVFGGGGGDSESDGDGGGDENGGDGGSGPMTGDPLSINPSSIRIQVDDSRSPPVLAARPTTTPLPPGTRFTVRVYLPPPPTDEDGDELIPPARLTDTIQTSIMPGTQVFPVQTPVGVQLAVGRVPNEETDERGIRFPEQPDGTGPPDGFSVYMGVFPGGASAPAERRFNLVDGQRVGSAPPTAPEQSRGIQTGFAPAFPSTGQVLYVRSVSGAFPTETTVTASFEYASGETVEQSGQLLADVPRGRRVFLGAESREIGDGDLPLGVASRPPGEIWGFSGDRLSQAVVTVDTGDRRIETPLSFS